MLSDHDGKASDLMTFLIFKASFCHRNGNNNNNYLSLLKNDKLYIKMTENTVKVLKVQVQSIKLL